MKLKHNSPLHLTEFNEKWFSIQEVNTLITQLRAEGIDCEALLELAGLDNKDLDDSHKLVSANQRVIVYKYALEHSANSAMALNCGQQMRIGSYGIWGYALMCCNTLEETLDFAFPYLRLAGPTMSKSMWLTDEDVVFRATDSLLLGDVFPFALEVWWSSVYSFVKNDILSGDLALSALLVPYAAPAHWKDYERIFNCPVTFSAGTCEMKFSRRYLTKKPVQANLMTAEMCEELCSGMLYKLTSSTDLATNIRNRLLKQSGHYPNLETMARELSMSPRNLRRRLQQDNTSYQKILTDTRYALAREYLGATALSIAQIAELVGFSDTANFQSAFKKWGSQTPAQFRKQHTGTFE